MKNTINFISTTIVMAVFLTLGLSNAAAQFVPRKLPGGFERQIPSQPQVETGVNRTATDGTVTGTISWPQTMGLPPMHPGASTRYPNACGLFVVHVKVVAGAPGSFGQFETVGRSGILQEPVAVNDYRRRPAYVCKYEIHGLPKDKGLQITVEFLDSRIFESEPWLLDLGVGGKSSPGAGLVRTFFGRGGATLTNDFPSASVDFRLTYGPPPSVPR